MKKIRLLVGITNENELYFLEISPKYEEQKHFSMTGFTVSPISEDAGEREARERLEDGEQWRMAVEAGHTCAGLKDWVEEVLNLDGWQHVLDCSLYPDEFNHTDGNTYHFISQACGQHQEKELKHYLIDKENFDYLMMLWDKYHLKKEIVVLPDWIEAEQLKTPVKTMERAFKLLEEDGELR